MLNRIIVAIDNSSSSQQVVDEAVCLAKATDAKKNAFTRFISS